MDFETYQKQLRNIDAQAEELKQQLRKLRTELDEAEKAKASAIKLQGEFEDFVSARKRAKNKPAKNPVLKAFKSFVKKADSLLTGSSYRETAEKVAEMKQVAERKIRACQEDISYCENQLRRLSSAKTEVTDTYNAEKARQEAQQ